MNKQIDAEDAKLKVLIDTESEEQKEGSEWGDKFTISNWNNRRWLTVSCFIKKEI